ncbi:MAG: hypothetical protein D3910_25500, partial [Candidatus Electrothrix sp. ATG2]|nr:hypothetical protein [Candidatus Electrothrix sp. ATG2]
YTPYKEDHQYGIGFGETLWFRPWLDTLLFAGAGLGMNEDLLEPDFLKFRFGIKQLFWPLQADLTSMSGYYFKDDDRDRDSVRNILRLDLIADHWQKNQRRLRGGFRIQTDLDTGEQSGFLYFSWIFSRSRGVRDFRAGELFFKGLRERKLVGTLNNTLEYE